MTNTTQDLVTEIVQALTPIFQKHLENVSDKQQPAQQAQPTQQKKPTLAEKTLDHIKKHTRLDAELMQKIVAIKFRDKEHRLTQNQIAQMTGSTQTNVSKYLITFKTVAREIMQNKHNHQTQLEVV